jgi:RNA polymerase sigma-70 factor (ECF subfamily)
VALNTAISYIRSQRTKPLTTPIDTAYEPLLHDGDFSDSIDTLERFLLTLNKIDKAIMMLYLDDISHKQIADITGLNTNVISVRINRMKQKFKQQHIGD